MNLLLSIIVRRILYRRRIQNARSKVLFVQRGRLQDVHMTDAHMHDHLRAFDDAPLRFLHTILEARRSFMIASSSKDDHVNFICLADQHRLISGRINAKN